MTSDEGVGLPVVILGLIIAAALFVPAVSEVVFQWVPATVSVITGVEMEGDVRYISEAGFEKEIVVALHPVRTTASRGVLVAQAASAFDLAAGNGNYIYEDELSSPILQQVSEWWNTIIPISIFISLLLLVGIIYAFTQLMRVRSIEKAVWDVAAHPVAGGDITKTQLRWNTIVEHVNTDNPNDWRQAIIEADIMLDELLTAQGYHGDTVGEKLKQIERSDFNTIDLAWEAHKVRNNIAHQGFEHELNAREVRRIIQLYEHVFQEFRYI